MYYKDAVGAFLMFDLTRADTFNAVQKWKEDLDSKVGQAALVVHIVCALSVT